MTPYFLLNSETINAPQINTPHINASQITLQPRYDRVLKISTEVLILQCVEIETVIEAPFYRVSIVLGGACYPKLR